MIEPTDRMIVDFEDAYDLPGISGGNTQAGLAAVIPDIEAALRERIADALEDHASRLRGEAFRSGEVSIEFICGIEDAAGRVRNGGPA